MRRNIKQGVAAIRQRMLILHYQRLYLFSLFYSGRSDHPLLAIPTSGIVSKPLHPHIAFLLYYIFLFFSTTNEEPLEPLEPKRPGPNGSHWFLFSSKFSFDFIF